MIDSNDNKKPAQNQVAAESSQSHSQKISTPTKYKLDRSRKITFNGNFCTTREVAEVIGVSRKAVEKWRKQKIFDPDFVDHTGVFYYSVERVMQLKSVYHKNWMHGGYKGSPTTGTDKLTIEPEIDEEDFLEEAFPLSASMRNQSALSKVFQGDDPIAIIKRLNGSIRPSRTRVEINEKLAKVVFKLSDEGMSDLLGGDTFEIVEKRNHKNRGEILTAYKILNAAGYNIQRPFRLFDRFVLSACISEWLAGNRYTTPGIIYRNLTGKVDKGCNAKPSKDQLAAILDSIKILMCRNIDCTAKDLCEVLGYNDGKALSLRGALLPAIYFDATEENGLDGCSIFFLAESPLFTIAQAKRQIITYDLRLLDIPNQQNTPMNIEIKNYCMLRVKEILAHKQLTPTITFRDVFEKARMRHADGKTKLRAREFLKAFFEQLQNNNIVVSFKVTRNNRGFQSIRFT